MSVLDGGAASVAGSGADAAASSDGVRPSGSVRDMTLKDIISGMKKRRGAKPMPSAVQRAEERRKRRRREAQGLPPEDTPDASHQPPAPEKPHEQQQQKDGAERNDEEDDEEDVVAPQVKIDDDGNIVIDQASLVVSAGTAANAETDRAAVTVENHAFSNHITSATYSKRESAMKWEAEETERFYAALRKFGTDFSLMESSFPKRSRRQLKLKFKREEKEFPQRVDQALNGPPLPLSPAMKKKPPPKEPESDTAGPREKQNAEEATTKDDDLDSDESAEGGHAKENKDSGSDSDESD